MWARWEQSKQWYGRYRRTHQTKRCRYWTSCKHTTRSGTAGSRSISQGRSHWRISWNQSGPRAPYSCGSDGTCAAMKHRPRQRGGAAEASGRRCKRAQARRRRGSGYDWTRASAPEWQHRVYWVGHPPRETRGGAEKSAREAATATPGDKEQQLCYAMHAYACTFERTTPRTRQRH